MPSKTVKKTTPPVETPVQNVVSEPVQNVVETQAVQPKQKGGKKNAKAPLVVETASSTVVETTPTPVVETASVPVVEVTPAKLKNKKGGAKPKVTAAASVVTTDEVVKKEPKKRVAKSKQAVEGSEQKVVAKKRVKKETKPETEAEIENEESSDRRVRSFKVKLPDKEDFEGRFTGLTPYQAANKALSKYFRETENPKKEITFIICESTRKSKKAVYTYIGKRYQLEVPVKYTIQDGRVIVKNFKNSLKKVKKVDLTGGAPVVAPVVA